MQVFHFVFCLMFFFFDLCPCQEDPTDAEDCILYEGIVGALNFPKKTMHRILSTGVQPLGSQFTATLSLTSNATGDKCDIHIFSAVMAISCAHQSHRFDWSPHIFKEEDFTEMWLFLGSLSDPKDSESSDLAIIARRGRQRNHLVFPASGLRPPLQVHWEPLQPMDYYFNCVTGCMYTKTAVTSPSEHSIFLRPGQNFTELHIAYNSTEHRTFHELVLNSSHVVLDDNWKNVTVVWNAKEGDIGALIDGIPISGLSKFSKLGRNGLAAEVRGESGYLALCDQNFKNVGDAGSIRDVSSSSSVPAASPRNLSDGSSSANWVVVLAIGVCVLLALVTVLAIMLLRTKKQLRRERDVCAREIMPVEAIGGTHLSTIRSTVPLCPSPEVSSSPNEPIKRVKNKAPVAPGGGGGTEFSLNGP